MLLKVHKESFCSSIALIVTGFVSTKGMDYDYGSFLHMQEAMKELDLQPKAYESRLISDTMLVGKVLSTRNFRRSTISEIVSKTWRMAGRITVEKLEENTFKFTVGTKEERDRIFNGRSWSLNGAHMILKVWDAYKVLDEFSFRNSTFILQIHGLPLLFVHERRLQRKLAGELEKFIRTISTKNALWLTDF